MSNKTKDKPIYGLSTLPATQLQRVVGLEQVELASYHRREPQAAEFCMGSCVYIPLPELRASTQPNAGGFATAGAGHPPDKNLPSPRTGVAYYILDRVHKWVLF